jgi:hypothetical protein
MKASSDKGLGKIFSFGGWALLAKPRLKDTYALGLDGGALSSLR